MAKMTLNPAAPPRFTAADRARLEALSTVEIEANALADVDNPPLTDAELTQMEGAQLARAARGALGLSQPVFARMFRINVARLRDMEQGRFKPDGALAAYLTVIRQEPDAVKRALGIQPRGAKATARRRAGA